MAEWLRAMTYNVRYDNPADGEHAWEHRRAAVASTIRFHAPDVIGLQEPLDHQLAAIDEGVPGFEFVGGGRLDGEDDGEHTPIGYRTERLTCEDHGTFWLSETPDEPGSVGWDARHPRIVTWARLYDRATDSRYVHANTHFSHDGPQARVESARLVRERLASVADGLAVVLTGDFNCVTGEPAFDGLTAEDDRLRLYSGADRSPYDQHGPPTSVTDFENLVPNRKIDHVFVTDGIAVGQHGVCSDCYEDGRFPSDHLPVLAELDPTGA